MLHRVCVYLVGELEREGNSCILLKEHEELFLNSSNHMNRRNPRATSPKGNGISRLANQERVSSNTVHISLRSSSKHEAGQVLKP